MDKSIRKNVLLGFFVVVGIILFTFGIFQIGVKNEMFAKTFVITAKFRNATGLKVGGNVRYNGVKAGIVKSVNLINDSMVQVDMQIEESKRIFITRSAIATIASDGLMGDKLVNITNGKNEGAPVQNNDLIASHNPLNFDEAMQTLNESNKNVKAISENLKEITADINDKNGVVQMLYKDTGIASQLKQSFLNLNTATDNVREASTSIQHIAQQLAQGHGTIGKILNDSDMGNNLAYTVDNLKETSDKLNKISDQLGRAVQQVNSGNGTVGLLLNDTTFSAAVKQSVTNIKQASQGLNEDIEGLKHSFLLKKYFRKKAQKNKKTR